MSNELLEEIQQVFMKELLKELHIKRIGKRNKLSEESRKRNSQRFTEENPQKMQ